MSCVIYCPLFSYTAWMLSPLPLSALFISVACYLKQKVNNSEPEGTRPRTDPSATGLEKKPKQPSLKPLILAKLSQFGAACVSEELEAKGWDILANPSKSL